jgi:hypothetical protein
MKTEDWMKDSDTVFTAVSTGDFDNFNQAQQAVVEFYVPDMTITRAGISHALKRLENFYTERSKNKAAKTTEGFEDWWHNIGSAIRPLPGQDHEEHGRRIAQITWETATLHAREKP